METKDWRMVEPCTGCPFNRSGLGLRIRKGLRPSRWREILSGLRRGDVFPCHKTTIEDDDTGEAVRGPHERICAGAIAYQEHHGCTSNLQRVMERVVGAGA